MKRRQLFEFEDFTWFPGWLRQYMTLYLVAMHKAVGTEQLLLPLVKRTLDGSGARSIVDLCSGGGGPMPKLIRKLREEQAFANVTLTLTDLFPNKTAAATLNQAGEAWLRYETAPVDAGNVAVERRGLRTMICSMHHMPPAVARRILTDAAEKRQPFLFYEITDNSLPLWMWIVTFPLSCLLVMVFTLMVRPLSLGQILLTYLVPILPLVISWDGLASNVRTYAGDDVRELLEGIGGEDYRWEAGVLKNPRMPGGMSYLIGMPVAQR